MKFVFWHLERECLAFILKKTGFRGTLLEILCTFCKGLDKVYRNLHTPHDLTGDEYEVQARIHLGFMALQILLLPLNRFLLMLDTMWTRHFWMLKLFVFP